MSFTEKIIEKIASRVCGKTNIKYEDENIELKSPYERISFPTESDTKVSSNSKKNSNPDWTSPETS